MGAYSRICDLASRIPMTLQRPYADGQRSWKRHFVYRVERTRTTWKFRFALLTAVLVALMLTSGWWMERVSRSLVCEQNVARSDAILLENFDTSYRVFERARDLRRDRLANRVLVPIAIEDGGSELNAVALRTAELMADVARLGSFEVVPISYVEPISLNAGLAVKRYLQREGIASVIVVTPLFRSRRSALVYDATVARAGIRVSCQPVEGSRGLETWHRSWHGVQEVMEQWFKLQYYRMYVLPFSDLSD